MSTESFFKRLGMWLFLIAGLMLVVNLSRGVFDLWSVQGRVKEAEEKLQQTKAEKQETQDRLMMETSESNKEKIIRDKLNMAKPGEKVIVLPETASAAAINLPVPTPTEKVDQANWKLWWQVFGGE